jgi:aldose 1-epimerase
MSPPPSGEQHELAFADQRATVVEVGGGLRTYSVGPREILDGYAEDAMCRSGRGQVLAPWPNRIEGGEYIFGNVDYQLALTEPKAGNAIHGLVRWANWSLLERDEARVTMGYLLHPQPGYPFTVRFAVEYALGADGLTVRTTAVNEGTAACPFGAGHHPYFAAPTGRVDDMTLDGEPIGDRELDDTQRMDAPWRLRIDDVTLWADEQWKHVQLFTGDPLPDVNRRALAVEPMTCPPNAFRSGEDLIVLEPGERFTGTWGISVA